MVRGLSTSLSIAIAVASMIIFSPLKMLAYFAPVLFVMVVYGLTGRLPGFGRVLAALTAYSAVCLIYVAGGTEVSFWGAALQVLTLSSFVALFVFSSRNLRYQRTLWALLPFLGALFLFESLFGIGQAIIAFGQSGSFDSANGDHVQGTIFPSTEIDSAFANPMFSANLILGLSFIAPHIRRMRLGWIVFIAMSLCALLASVMHQLVFAVLAWLIAPRLNGASRAQLRKFAVAALLLVATFGGVFVFLPQNLSSFIAIYDDFERGDSPRRIMLANLATTLPEKYPWQPLVGLGPSRFCSRAALITTGLYFRSFDVSRYIPTKITEPQSIFLMRLWNEASTNRYYGSSQKPFFSWMSVYAEFGLLGLGLALTLMARIMYLVRRHALAYPSALPAWNSIQASILFLALLSFQENYLEIPQAIFLGVLLTALQFRSAQELARSNGVRL
jgi:hypothetical protein